MERWQSYQSSDSALFSYLALLRLLENKIIRSQAGERSSPPLGKTTTMKTNGHMEDERPIGMKDQMQIALAAN